jgi:hypothetical protein
MRPERIRQCGVDSGPSEVDEQRNTQLPDSRQLMTTSLCGAGHRFQQAWFQGFVGFHKSRTYVWTAAQIHVRGTSDAQVGREWPVKRAAGTH